MRSKVFKVAMVVALFAISIGVAHALMIMPPPGPARVVNSDVVFVGKVISIEPAEVDVKPFPDAKDTVKYKVAVVKVTEMIRGPKDVKSLRVGFQALQAFKGPKIGGRGPVQLTVDQEGLFMISMHTDGKFYQAPNFGYFTPTAQKNFEDEVKTAKRYVSIMANTKEALESKDADERLIAAAIVVTKYRTQKAPFPNKEEPIAAAESRLILNAIASAKWGPVKFGEPNPQQLFFQLGINQKDGWQSPKKITGPNDMRDAVQAWIKNNPDYRVKRFVSAETK
jgi:hypothetical protein